jgi:hypothetical protein
MTHPLIDQHNNQEASSYGQNGIYYWQLMIIPHTDPGGERQQFSETLVFNPILTWLIAQDFSAFIHHEIFFKTYKISIAY